jgi:hypothetical protein
MNSLAMLGYSSAAAVAIVVSSGSVASAKALPMGQESTPQRAGKVTISAKRDVIHCELKVANPHYSHHAAAKDKDRVNVVATLKCDRSVSGMKIKVRLYKKGVKYKESGWKANNYKNSISVNAARRCVAKQKYQGQAWAYVWAPAGYQPPMAYMTIKSKVVYISKCKKG